MDLEELEIEALKLSPDLRARLAEKLLHSLEALSDAENERLWAEEALRRHNELEAGAATVRSAEDVFRDARSRLP
jgi:putative addiction module component (TIGR02574 family)